MGLTSSQRRQVRSATVLGAFVGVPTSIVLAVAAGWLEMSDVLDEFGADTFLGLLGMGAVVGAVPGALLGRLTVTLLSRLRRSRAERKVRHDSALGEGLWSDHYLACKRHVDRFGKSIDGLDGAAGEWLAEMHTELIADLSQVRALAELGQRLAPNKHGTVFAEGHPAREIHARLEESRHRFSALADEAGRIAVTLIERPDVEDVRRDLTGLHSVVIETRDTLGA